MSTISHCIAIFVFTWALTPGKATLNKEESVTVVGQALCGEEWASSGDTWATLMNDESGTNTKEDGKVGEDGKFRITLTDKQFVDNMDAELHLYTDCNHDILFGLIDKPCQRKLVFKIPKESVNSGHEFNTGTFQLAMKYEGETTDCDMKRTMTAVKSNVREFFKDPLKSFRRS